VTSATAAEQLDSDNPWPGLESFDEYARAFFHGRDHESTSLLSHVLDAPITLLYGRSGLGKTSLLRAGLFPLLRDSHFLPVYVRFDLEPGAAPLTRQLRQSVYDSIRAHVPDPMLPLEDESLWEYLHRTDFELSSEHGDLLTPVIVLDQFEELCMPAGRVPDLVREFKTEVGDLAENRIPADHLRKRNYKLVICLREEFLHELEGWRQLIPAPGRSRMRLLPMRASEALDAVHKPAEEMMSRSVARRVVGIIAGENLHRARGTAFADIDRPGDDFDPSGGASGAPEVEPALLSLFCRELNEERKRRGESHFDELLVEDARRDILANYYLSCVRDHPPRVAQFIESELITERGFRDSYVREEAVPSRLTDDELTRLIGSRLLRLQERYGAQRIELTHDVLTDVIREHRDRRRGGDTKAALAARADSHQAGLEAAHRRTAALRKRSRILVAALAVTAVIALVAVMLGVQAVQARHEAQLQLRQKLLTQRQILVAEAQDMLAGTQPGGDARAFQQILAARALLNPPDDGPLYTAVAQRASTLKIITGHTGAVNGVAFRPDGHRLATVGLDKTVRVWDAETGQQVGAPLTGHEDNVIGVAFSPDGRRLASASLDRTVRVWDAETGQQVGAPLRGHTGSVLGVAFSPDGNWLATASTDRTVQLWDARTGYSAGARLVGHTGSVVSVAFSPDGQRLATASDDQTVRLWDARTGQPVGAPLVGHIGPVLSVVFRSDGHRLASASMDKTVRIWDADTGQGVAPPLTGHINPVQSVAFSPDGHGLATASADQTVRLWDADTGHDRGPSLIGHSGIVNGVVFSPDGRRLATASSDGTVRLWDAGQPFGAPLTGHTGKVNSVVFSPDGRRLASGSDDQSVRLWEAGTGQAAGAPLGGHTGDVNGVAISPDGRRLASGSDDQTVRMWDAGSGKSVGAPLVGHTGPVLSVVFSPDGRQLASAGADQTVRLWDAATGKSVAVLTGHTGKVNSVVFSPGGRRLASAGADQTVRLWDAGTGQSVAILRGHAGPVLSVAFSPDGRRLATASADETVRRWDAETGQSIGDPLKGNGGAANAVVFSPNGRRLATAESEGTVQLWDATTGEPFGAFHTGPVLSVAFSPDGQRLASAGADTTVRLWPADASPEMLCAKLTSNMSRQQWRDWVSPDMDYVKLCPGLPIAGSG
jgi:WD40 repeat protein